MRDTQEEDQDGYRSHGWISLLEIVPGCFDIVEYESQQERMDERWMMHFRLHSVSNREDLTRADFEEIGFAPGKPLLRQ